MVFALKPFLGHAQLRAQMIKIMTTDEREFHPFEVVRIRPLGPSSGTWLGKRTRWMRSAAP